MKQIEIDFDRRHTTCVAPEYSVSGKVLDINLDSIKRLLNKERKKICRWLLFGEAQMLVVDCSTCRAVATGKYSYNAFASHGEFELKLTNEQ